MNNRKHYEKKKNERRHDFLKTFFENEEGYDEKEVNGFWLVKYLNRDTNSWKVAIYTKDSFKNYKRFDNIIGGN